MRSLTVILAGLLALPIPPGARAQEPAPKLNLVIVEGEGAINNIRQRTAREPIVQVEDENHRPVAGVAVVFLLPESGAGGTFANGAHSLTVVTDQSGRAVARGMRPNNVQGQFQIHVSASHNGVTATGVITQTNALAAGAATAAAVGISAKLIAIIAVGAAAVAGGTYYATHAGGGNNTTTATPTSITAGAASVGAPPR